MVDFVSLVGEGTGDVPVFLLVGSDGVVGLNVGGVGGIESIFGVDDLSRDDLFSSSLDVSV